MTRREFAKACCAVLVASQLPIPPRLALAAIGPSALGLARRRRPSDVDALLAQRRAITNIDPTLPEHVRHFVQVTQWRCSQGAPCTREVAQRTYDGMGEYSWVYDDLTGSPVAWVCHQFASPTQSVDRYIDLAMIAIDPNKTRENTLKVFKSVTRQMLEQLDALGYAGIRVESPIQLGTLPGYRRSMAEQGCVETAIGTTGKDRRPAMWEYRAAMGDILPAIRAEEQEELAL